MAKSVYDIIISLEGQERARAGIESLGASIGLLGAAMTALSAKAAQLGADYEEALAKASTVATDATGSSEELDQAFSELSRTLEGNISKTEAAEAAYQVLSAGFSDQADILAILETSQKGAIAGFSDLTSVADISTTVMNAYGEQLGENLTVQEKMDVIMNQFINTQNRGKVTIDQLAQGLGNITASMAAAGVDFTELTSAIAAITAKTGNAESAFTNLNQAVTAFNKPSGQALELAAELGLEWGGAAFQANGLTGTLRNLNEVQDLTYDQLVVLLGSQEAVAAITPLLGEGFDNFTDILESNANATGLVNDAYETMADTANQKFIAAANQMRDALADMGRGVLIAVTPLIEMVNKLLIAFNSLDPSVKQFIGAAVGLTGVVATLTGGLLLAVAASGKLYLEMKAGIVILGKIGAQLGLYNATLLKTSVQSVLAAKSFTQLKVATVALSKALIPVAGAAIAATAAVASLALAYKQYENIRAEENAREMFSDLQETDGLALKISELSARMRESGEAIPDEEWDRWIAMLRDADNGTLTGMIDALERQRNGLLESAEATDQSTAAISANSATVDEWISHLDDKISAIESNANAEIALIEATAQSEEEALRQTAEIRQRALQEMIALEQQKLQHADLSAEQQAEIQNRINTLRAESVNLERDTSQQLIQIAQDRQLALNEAAKAELESRQVMGDIGGLEYINELERVTQEEINIRRSAIEQQLSLYSEGSAERIRLETELTQLTLAENQNRMDAERARVDEISNLNQARLDAEIAFIERLELENRISEEEALTRRSQFNERQLEIDRERLTAEIEMTAEGSAERAQLEAELQETYLQFQQEQTAIFKEELDRRLEALRLSVAEQSEALQGSIDLGAMFNDFSSASSDFVGGLQSVVDEVGSALSSEDLTEGAREAWENLGTDVLSNLRALGLDINQNQSIQNQLADANREIALAQLQIKQAQLAIEHEITQAQLEQQRIELEGQREIEQLRQQSGTLTESEMRQSELNEEIANRGLQNVNRQAALNDRSFNLQNQLTDFQIEAAQISGMDANGNRATGLNEAELEALTNPESMPEFNQPADPMDATKGQPQIALDTGDIPNRMGNIEGTLGNILTAIQNQNPTTNINVTGNASPEVGIQIQEDRVSNARRRSK